MEHSWPNSCYICSLFEEIASSECEDITDYLHALIVPQSFLAIQIAGIIKMMNLNTVKPNQPKASEWDALSTKQRALMSESILDVIVPVYGAPDDTLRCIFSVLSAENTIAYNLIVIEDCGPDPSLRDKLLELSQRFGFEYHENKENQGFVLTCNRGFLLHENRDVILLNSDTEVFDGWLDRIIGCATKNPRAGTITAMSNNATICSYPFFCEDYPHAYEVSDAQLDQLFAKVNSSHAVDAPTGVGFCMYVRRACLQEIGMFNYELFGQGYGEENDLCVRAENAGWTNLIATDVFVRHYGSSSFSNAVRSERVKKAIKTLDQEHPNYLSSVKNFIKANPMKKFLTSVDHERLIKFIDGREVFLHVTHSFGGGTEKHHLELVERLSQEGFAVATIKPFENGKVMLYLDGKYPLPNLKIPLQDKNELMHYLKHILRVSKVHVHHLKGFSDTFITNFFAVLVDSSIPYYFTVHDYFPICPRINLISTDGFLYCGEPELNECNRCINGLPEVKSAKNRIENWRLNYQAIFSHAEKIFVPDDDVKWRLQRYFPSLEFVTRPHFDKWIVPNTIVKKTRVHGGSIRIGIVGAIGPHKGYYQIHEIAEKCKQLQLDIVFVIIGYTADDISISGLGNVEILGKYQDNELIEKIIDADLDAMWFPAVWPETYSYTLSAVLPLNLPIIAFDFGAVGRRLRNLDHSLLIPIEKMLEPVQVIQYFLRDFSMFSSPADNSSDIANGYYEKMSRDYYLFE